MFIMRVAVRQVGSQERAMAVRHDHCIDFGPIWESICRAYLKSTTQTTGLDARLKYEER